VKLFNFQKDAVRFLYERSSPSDGAMLAMEPGLGKTICALKAAHKAGMERVLIVAPLSLLKVWADELMRWGISDGTDIAYWWGAQPRPEYRWNITNYDTIRLRGTPKRSWDCVILDESVLLKNRRSKRWRSVRDLLRDNKWAVRWMLSGYPVTKYIDDLWAQMSLLDRKRFGGYWDFVGRYCRADFGSPFGTIIYGNRPDAEEDFKRINADLYYSCRQEDVKDETGIPDFLIEPDVVVPMGGAHNNMYRQMQNEFQAWFGEDEEELITAPNVMVQMLRLAQIGTDPRLVGVTELNGIKQFPKYTTLLEMLEYSPRPAIVWVHHVQVGQRVADLLRDGGYEVLTLTGSTPPAERKQVADKFQTGGYDVLVANPSVGKYGLTLTAARCAIYFEHTFDVDAYSQSLLRIKRIGTTLSPVVYHLAARTAQGERTIDDLMLRVLRDKKFHIEKLTVRDVKQYL
jgi:SNF2 family DNA or RNA helicase